MLISAKLCHLLIFSYFGCVHIFFVALAACNIFFVLQSSNVEQNVTWA